MAELDKKKKSRAVTRGAFTRLSNEFEQLLATQPIDMNKVQVSWELLHSKYDDLKVLDSEFYELSLDQATEQELLIDTEICDGYRKKFINLRVSYEKLLNISNQTGQASVVSASVVNENAAKRKYKLPKIEFKHFDGNIKDWLPFWSQFRKIHDDPDVDECDKIEYLIQSTVPSSRARQLVESFPAISGNYGKIIESMQSRFGREDLQIEVYVRELLKLVLNNAISQQKMDLCTLYDRIETQIRSLETLGVTSNKCSAMLFPLIESCLPQELLRVWQRTAQSVNVSRTDSASPEASLEDRLASLMRLLKNEVQNEERISLAAESFGFSSTHVHSNETKVKGETRKGKISGAMPTAMDLVNYDVAKCIFCNGSHVSESCFKARNFSFDEKKKLLVDKRACFRCLTPGHSSKKCRNRLRCLICSRSHVPLMCPDLPSNKQQSDKKIEENVKGSCAKDQTLANHTNTHVFLQTLRVVFRGKNGSRVGRALIDSGSQRSYILKSTAIQLGYKPKRKENVVHCLFGGTEVTNIHNCYDVTVYKANYTLTFEVLDQTAICSDILPVFHGPWSEELRRMHIDIPDACNGGPIELLIGADVAGTILSGNHRLLQCGLVAVETRLGWTIMGKISEENKKVNSNLACTTLSLLVKDASITELWRLDVLGITEPSEKKTREELANAAKDFFLQTVEVNKEGRYQVRLPWLEGHPPLPNNYGVARKRLTSTVKKLKNDNLVDSYDQVFQEWLSESIIEEVSENDSTKQGHYLPHRPVIKESSCTTKIRPVFDASSHEKEKPSLNHCLEKGLNLIEQIPSILLRFRENQFGVVADIRKAFLQISIHPNDRDFLKFLWIDPDEKERVYRHRRVVFGINSSPFLLGATIEYHLSRCLENCGKVDTPYTRDTVVKLARSFYVDNCVTSVENEVNLQRFIKESKLIMEEGKFDLRGWEYTRTTGLETEGIPVLGLKWQPDSDTLAINDDCLKLDPDFDKIVTKRLILSMSQRIFDPVGFTCPATLMPKLLLQRLWEKKLPWDEPVDAEVEHAFRDWFAELPCLLKIKVPRCIGGIGNNGNQTHCTLHTFCDASKDAFSCVIFIRSVKDGTVRVYLLAAKARVAPLRKLTIPRLELLAATIGSRLYANLRQNLEASIRSYFWSDSSTVIAWIQRKEEWSTFVWNRVAEIRSLTSVEDWRHVPGTKNPADLPSRGCTPRLLLDSRWWEGPKWLYLEPDGWPRGKLVCDEFEIGQEKKGKLITTLLSYTSNDWHFTYFSVYSRTLRMMAWVLRFVHNISHPDASCKGELTVDEINMAERFIFKVIQLENFSGMNDKRLSGLKSYLDEYGLLRLRSRISRREDLEDFRFSILLPSKHPVVNSLILEIHKNRSHVGVQGLLSLLREKYWILGGRHTIKSVISKCITCRRYDSRPFAVESPPLPLDRVRDANVFEVTGLDMAGPLFLKTGEKAWICLFTCAVYRAVHLELCTSLSTHCFMNALRRFVARRGRPSTIYSDNGTNFTGAENALVQLNWENILKETSVQRITWRFNPPTAPWWGGFWERLIGVMMQLLRKVLGRSCLTYEDLTTVLCDCESVINSRPLTYVSNDPEDFMPITPSMFLRDQVESSLPDCDLIDQSSLHRKLRNQQKLRDDLRRRFRSEYLGQLKVLRRNKTHRPIVLGELVLVGDDKKKRLDWPLGRVTELLPGKDNLTRLVRLQTFKGQMLRPVQRLYPLECLDIGLGAADYEDSNIERKENAAEVVEQKDNYGDVGRSDDQSAGVFLKSRVPDKTTRSGRVVHIPKRFL